MKESKRIGITRIHLIPLVCRKGCIELNFLDQLKLQALRRFEEETKSTDAALDLHLRVLESAVKHATDAILITEAAPLTGPGPLIQYINPAFTRILGYLPEEIVGKVPHIMYGPLTDVASLENIQRSLRESRAAEVEVVCYKKDGSIFSAEVSISPISIQQGFPTKWIYILRDVSERKLAEDLASKAQETEEENKRLIVEITERKATEVSLTHNAFHDSLTGLRNRAYFLDRLKEALRHSKSRPSYRGAVLYLDLDGFKAINDNLGHRAGDSLLTEIARKLEQCCRPQDTICRLGGDEFAILIDDVQALDGITVAQRILDRMRVPSEVIGGQMVVSASLGLCEIEPKYDQVEEIIRDADTAMYRAKQQGGSRCASFDEAMQESAMAILQSKRQLQSAVQHGEFELHYQPLVETRGMPPRLWGVEALVRWRHPNRGLLGPDEFIPLAEQTGLIIPLGLWVLRAACLQLKDWQKSVLRPDFMLSINISGRQLNDPAFFPDMVDVLAETEVDARSLQIEITEGILLQESKRVGELLEKIRRLGIQVALDQFGTGYSSLAQLERYPIDTLKIDKSLIFRLGEGVKQREMPRLIIDLARTLGIKVSAEGIEDRYQSSTLREYGCTLVQGFLYSAAVPVGKMTALLDEGITSEHAGSHTT